MSMRRREDGALACKGILTFDYRCRAQVVNVEPLTVYFIDYGNTEFCKVADLHSLPQDLQKNPPPLVSIG